MQYLQPQHAFKLHKVHCVIIRINTIFQAYGTGSMQDSKAPLSSKLPVNTMNSLASQNPQNAKSMKVSKDSVSEKYCQNHT